MHKRLGVLALVVGAMSLAYGQPFPLGSFVPPKRGLDDNTSKLKTTLTLDREEYLPGEAAEVTITITNPTAGPLEVYAPFTAGTGSLFVDFQNPDPKRPNASGQPLCCWMGRNSTLPTRWFAAGETVTQTFHSWDDQWGYGEPILRMPQGPGEFKLDYYGYSNGGHLPSVKFRVVAATVGVDEYIPIQRKGHYQDQGKEVEVSLRIPVAVIDAAGKHYIVAAVRPGSKILRDNRGVVLGGAGTLSPYVRIAESEQPIVAINGVERVKANVMADVGKEDLAVTWRTADGKQSTVDLGTDRKPLK